MALFLLNKIKHILGYLKTLVYWIILSIIIGVVIGSAAAIFAYLIVQVTAFRVAHPIIIAGLPLGGLLIVFLYRSSGEARNNGTDLVISAVRSNEDVPLHIAPLILCATIITHLFGGSAGREGAALQFGGSMGSAIGKLFHLPDDFRKIAIMAGMSAAFSALFGTPLAAAIFSMEVISVGVLYYAALVPCVFSAFIARYMAVRLHVSSLQTPFPIENLPNFFSLAAAKTILLALACAGCGVLFCVALKYSSLLYKKAFPNQYARAAAGGCFVILLALVLRTQEYLGVSTHMIQSSLVTPSAPYAFVLKIIFTCLTLCAGYKGGEIVPSLCIGAAMGSSLSVLLGLPADICAACGMVGVFCAVTNSPITSLLIAFELFGFEGMPYYCSVIAVSYMLSGYYGLYHEQKIVYSKTEPKYINRQSR